MKKDHILACTPLSILYCLTLVTALSPALCVHAEEAPIEIVEDMDVDTSDRGHQTSAIEGYEDLEEFDVQEEYIDAASACESRSSHSPDGKPPAVIERILRVDTGNNRKTDFDKMASVQDASHTAGDVRATHPELGSTAHKMRKIIHTNTPVLKKRRNKNSLIPNAASVSEKHIEPMIEGHQVLGDPDKDKTAQKLLMKVTVN
jgi:hypothetical protein